MSTSTTSAQSSGQGASICCFCSSVFAPRRESHLIASAFNKGCAKEQVFRGDSPLEATFAHALQPRPSPDNVGPRRLDRPDCCGFVELPHTRREWLKQSARCPRCRSRHGRLQKYRPVLPARTVVTKRPRRWAPRRSTTRQEQPPSDLHHPTPTRLVTCTFSAASTQPSSCTSAPEGSVC